MCWHSSQLLFVSVISKRYFIWFFNTTNVPFWWLETMKSTQGFIKLIHRPYEYIELFPNNFHSDFHIRVNDINIKTTAQVLGWNNLSLLLGLQLFGLDFPQDANYNSKVKCCIVIDDVRWSIVNLIRTDVSFWIIRPWSPIKIFHNFRRIICWDTLPFICKVHGKFYIHQWNCMRSSSPAIERVVCSAKRWVRPTILEFN